MSEIDDLVDLLERVRTLLEGAEPMHEVGTGTPLRDDGDAARFARQFSGHGRMALGRHTRAEVADLLLDLDAAIRGLVARS